MKTFLTLIALLPLGYAYYKLESAIDPIKMLYTTTGVGAMVLLLLSLVPSTCKRVYGQNFLRYRKTIGLLSFVYALLHVSVFVVLDSEFDFVTLFEKSLKKPFIYVGVIAFFILLFMALTSFKKLFAKFSKYHKAVYLALALALLHSFWAQKVAGVFEYGIVAVGVVLLWERVWAWKTNFK
ncbi:ferric reductase-like transmembrane domain-containing protein [Sulfurospirillum deleyianum]|uniref:Ferric reductase domain protein protein transmembrane component domain protein n=1 Tax=Sulfurospirillum deleyianum (strain ATCC 51133 / DSM 6946 / 5175) TaxID=525898 RepID=D1B376_SULD5|nr:ferric reductase-like transmembrane domain-containing protein [Sulfurospirillum deleyianum]ACZ12546.1 Ferric reductase domain protein protein transmembrane component domain protein [Sulfurospirillum deleyianum DSM 6946]